MVTNHLLWVYQITLLSSQIRFANEKFLHEIAQRSFPFPNDPKIQAFLLHILYKYEFLIKKGTLLLYIIELVWVSKKSLSTILKIQILLEWVFKSLLQELIMLFLTSMANTEVIECSNFRASSSVFLHVLQLAVVLAEISARKKPSCHFRFICCRSYQGRSKAKANICLRIYI